MDEILSALPAAVKPMPRRERNDAKDAYSEKHSSAGCTEDALPEASSSMFFEPFSLFFAQ
jgi:hypothetical protein